MYQIVYTELDTGNLHHAEQYADTEREAFELARRCAPAVVYNDGRMCARYYADGSVSYVDSSSMVNRNGTLKGRSYA